MFRMEQDESHHSSKPEQDQQCEACQNMLDGFKKKVFQTSLWLEKWRLCNRLRYRPAKSVQSTSKVIKPTFCSVLLYKIQENLSIARSQENNDMYSGCTDYLSCCKKRGISLTQSQKCVNSPESGPKYSGSAKSVSHLLKLDKWWRLTVEVSELCIIWWHDWICIVLDFIATK